MFKRYLFLLLCVVMLFAAPIATAKDTTNNKTRSFTIYDQKLYPKYKVEIDKYGNGKVYDIDKHYAPTYRIQGDRMYDMNWNPQFNFDTDSQW